MLKILARQTVHITGCSEKRKIRRQCECWYVQICSLRYRRKERRGNLQGYTAKFNGCNVVRPLRR